MCLLTGPGFNPPNTEKLLSFNVRVNELLGRPIAGQELLHARLCFNAKWTAEETAEVLEVLSRMPELSTLAGEKASGVVVDESSPQPSTIPST